MSQYIQNFLEECTEECQMFSTFKSFNTAGRTETLYSLTLPVSRKRATNEMLDVILTVHHELTIY